MPRLQTKTRARTRESSVRPSGACGADSGGGVVWGGGHAQASAHSQTSPWAIDLHADAESARMCVRACVCVRNSMHAFDRATTGLQPLVAVAGEPSPEHLSERPLIADEVRSATRHIPNVCVCVCACARAYLSGHSLR